jgi:hypothetical protein
VQAAFFNTQKVAEAVPEQLNGNWQLAGKATSGLFPL